eukprot:587363-Pyramimonas_sp.AAC.1
MAQDRRARGGPTSRPWCCPTRGALRRAAVLPLAHGVFSYTAPLPLALAHGPWRVFSRRMAQGRPSPMA